MSEEKFQFGTDYQWDLLRFSVLDKDGYKAITKYEQHYFTLIEHSVIAHCLKNFYKNERRVPGETILKEEIRYLLNSREYKRVVTKDDETEIIKLCNDLYKGNVKDGDKILEKVKQFKSYTKLKETIENIDLTDFNKYKSFSKRVIQSITDEDDQRERRGTALVRDVKERQFNRQDHNTIFPTPYRQINKLTNAGGFAKGSIIVILDKPKKFKTGMMVNTAREYLKIKKKVCYIDLENGEDELMTRVEQSIMKKNKKEILSGDYDSQIQKTLRKYKRLGAELLVKRLPAGSDCNDIQNVLDEEYREFGLRYDVLIIDYAALMNSLSRKEDDTNRISDVYLDIANLALRNDLEHVWTAMHVKREASKRESTKYEVNDIAKCIDIIRHVQAIYGLNRNYTEQEEGFQRMEIVEQRDGKPSGKAVFKVDFETQRTDELTRADRKAYDEVFSNLNDDDYNGNRKNSKDI